MKFLNTLINKLKPLFIFQKQYVYRGSSEELTIALRKLNSDEIIKVVPGKNQYTVFARSSFGTWLRGTGISVTIDCSKIDETNQSLKISSRLRPENYIISIMFAFIFLIGFSSSPGIISFTFIPILYIVVILWFNFIYKVQEEKITERVKKLLKLKEVNAFKKEAQIFGQFK